ncbi:transaldolase [Carbonactinospora thermoautotrophica]|uniref:Transaldolase n=1 Tax=Carbonactinospora thermoautotrophica TaxID=1469144 RepID=A0A132MRE8_9ACTN|nr:transaldolase [Carbonactinospora thermoautotrophica]KWW97320.1 Transaldolase [Carbonactinospora thermoautotrophica]KWX00465.1 transaldolase [Carbonactinospora thermoautotrophica]KWX09761.1 transaldolase [Carbonactinospora thermoautotrophica]
MTDPLRQLSREGVAIWLDDLSRQRLVSGDLAALVRDKHVVGVTTNPTIFRNAISASDIYDEQLSQLAQLDVSAAEAVRLITTHDVRSACDVLRPIYEASEGRDGRVSIEVDPRLAHDTARTLAEARLLWWMVDRPNLLIKIPATEEGLPAISACLAEGISVNVTLIFSLARYEAVMAAFLDGIEGAQRAGRDLSRIGSVASFFISRVDTEIDRRLDKIGTTQAQMLRGKAAVANARLAYRLHEQVFTSERWRRLAAAGAQPQRPLWASTSVKDPAYDDTRYVVDLVAPGTVNTMPEATLQAVADHGVIKGDTVRGRYTAARELFDQLAAIGIDYDDVVRGLERDGVAKFQASWTELLEDVETALASHRSRRASC